MGWLSALIGALPALLQGIAAFQTKRAELIALQPSTNRQTIADDDAELARRKAAIPAAAESAPAVVATVPVAAKSNPYGVN